MEKSFRGLGVYEIWIGAQPAPSTNQALILLLEEEEKRRPAKLFYNGPVPFELDSVDKCKEWCDKNGGGGWSWAQKDQSFDIEQWLIDVEK